MERVLLRILGVAVGGYALLVVASAAMFRMDTAGGLEMVLQVDFVIGLALAISVVLVRVPAVGAGAAGRHGLTALGAVLAWAVVSGWLAWSHLEQHRIRSTLSVTAGD
jgi:hypothetical protein